MLIKKILFVILITHLVIPSEAQRIKECGTKPPLVKPIPSSEKMKKITARKLPYSAPFALKVFFRVFANDNGSNVAATEADVMRQFENMRIFYSNYSICFINIGYQVVRNSDLNNMDVDELDDFLKLADLVSDDYMNIFIHRNLVEGDEGLNGNAYSIPNNFLSVVASAIADTNNISTMAHEMGHCLGLLHTFEDVWGKEAVTRSGDCKDCEDDGDFLCDTQADLKIDDALISTSCQYNGPFTLVDDCGDEYILEETNIMTYGRRACRDHFSNGQGARALTYVLDDHSGRIAPNSLVVAYENLNAGFRTYAARESIQFTSFGYRVALAGMALFTSRSITFSPGVEFKPDLGYVEAKAIVHCQ